jgi:hypothetical protein
MCISRPLLVNLLLAESPNPTRSAGLLSSSLGCACLDTCGTWCSILISLLLAKVECEVQHGLVDGCAEVNQQVLESLSGLQIHSCDLCFKLKNTATPLKKTRWNLQKRILPM